ncbi:MAG: ATP phosphoribosyltransferase regulatory subunit, partial [Gemmatimonadales bacterium]
EKDFRVRLSDRRITEEWLSKKGIPSDVAYRRLDKWGARRVNVSDAAAEVGNQLGRFDDQLGELVSSDLAGLERALGSRHPGVNSLQSTLQTLAAMGLEEYLDFDPTIVRGLAYYTGTVFELFDAQGKLRAICGGGRYDTLVGELGGVDLPCVGFGMGDVVLGELLKERGLLPGDEAAIDIFIAAIEGDDLPHALRLAHELRGAGLRVEYALSAQPVGKQLRLADTRNARFAIVVASDERARGEVMLKDLTAKSQRPVRLEALVQELLELLNVD